MIPKIVLSLFRSRKMIPFHISFLQNEKPMILIVTQIEEMFIKWFLITVEDPHQFLEQDQKLQGERERDPFPSLRPNERTLEILRTQISWPLLWSKISTLRRNQVFEMSRTQMGSCTDSFWRQGQYFAYETSQRTVSKVLVSQCHITHVWRGCRSAGFSGQDRISQYHRPGFRCPNAANDWSWSAGFPGKTASCGVPVNRFSNLQCLKWLKMSLRCLRLFLKTVLGSTSQARMQIEVPDFPVTIAFYKRTVASDSRTSQCWNPIAGGDCHAHDALSRDRIQPRVSCVMQIFEVPLPARTAFCSSWDASAPRMIEVMMEMSKIVSQDVSQQHAPRMEQITEVPDLPAKTTI